MEMGRDQAHAGGDVEIFMNTARQMIAQSTRVDPATGTISTAADAVGPYEFLDDRILAAANQYCRFMLGYETPWVPAPCDIAPNGEIKGIYPRIADNYRGRIRGLDFWDMAYHYAYARSIDVAKKAPYYHEAFTKRIINSLTDWIYIPAAVTGEAARVAPREQEPAVVEVAQRSTLFNDKAAAVREGPLECVRISPTPEGTRIAILSAATDRKTVGLRVRTNGVAEVAMSGIAAPLLLPDTRGEWRYVTQQIGKFETFRDIEYFLFTGSPRMVVDIDKLVRIDAEKLGTPEFRPAARDERLVTYVGASFTADLSATGKGKTVVRSLDLPPGAHLDGETGVFSWSPMQPGNYAFVVNADDGEGAAARKIGVTVASDRASAVQGIASRFREDTPYTKTTLDKYRESLAQIRVPRSGMSSEVFQTELDQLQTAFAGLEPLTPRLPDGSMDYPPLVAASNLGESIGLLTDGNDDTFPVYTLAKDLKYVLDFGAGYQVSVSAFAMEGRLNFAIRTQDAALFGSNDGETWVQLTAPIPEPPTRLTKIAVGEEFVGQRFRYLKIEKTSRKGADMFEPSELRLYGQRYEAAP